MHAASTRMGGQPPIVVVGAHRSGTSLLTELLSDLGVFLGDRLDPNGESLFFLRHNEWVLRRAGGSWDHPLPALTFLASERFRGDVLALLEAEVRSRRFVEHAGRRDVRRSPGAEPGALAWGWKDPRNAFTFELWAHLFRGARLLAIHRNGVDAAHSLHVREVARWVDGRGVEDYLLMRPLERRPHEVWRRHEPLQGFLLSTRCHTLQESFRLWEEYSGRTQDLLESYDGPSLCLRYEELLADPLPQVEELARFCGLEVSPSALEQAAARVRSGRACAFLRDEGLRSFYRTVRSSTCMQRLGYGDLEAQAPA